MGSDAGASTPYSVAKICVWWDIENCLVPKGHDANSIALNITSALFNMNYRGPVSISAYGDTTGIPQPIQHALSSTGIALNHIPTGAKYGCHKKILVDMLLWAVDNPAPANYLLISDDTDFSNALHQLSMRKYNILLAQPPHAPPSSPLASPAKALWLWTTLSAGGPPLSFAHSDNNPAQPVLLKTKPKYVRKTTIVTTPTLPPLQLPPEIMNKKSKTNDEPNLQSESNFFFTAPHEYFTSKCNNNALIPFTERLRQHLTPGLILAMHEHNIAPAPALQETRDDHSRVSTSGREYVQGLVDVILRALNFLKGEMVFPTEANITDSIRYGDTRYQTIDVRKALDFALEQRKVEKRVFGAVQLYLGRNEMLWTCVNPISGHPTDFPPATWDKIRQFLTSSTGRSLILVSRCRYEACMMLWSSCLGDLVLGNVFKILEMMITVKKWIIHHHCGWQPITITLESKPDADSNSGVNQAQV